MQTTPVQAELAKIWTNILRYTTFALPNLLMMDCERYGANVFDVIELINRDYPRGGIAAPGMTAGTCLRKDFTFSEERSNAPGMLLAVSRVHETVPLFLVDGVKRRLGGSLRERRVAVLGLAFKRDTDDERDSLSHKLIRLLERELADVVGPRPDREHPDGELRGRRVRRRGRDRRHQPQCVLVARGPALDRRAGRFGLPARGPVERAGDRPGVRVCRRGGGAAGVSARGWAAFAAMSLIWGVPYLFIKVAVDDGVSPVFLSFVRVAMAAALLLVLAWRAGVLRQVRGRWGWIAAYAVIEITLPFPLIAAGEQYVSSSLTAILIASVPLIVAVLAIRFDPAERATGIRLLGLLIGFGGVVALVGIDVAGNADELLGAVLILLASCGYAAAPMILKRKFPDVDARASMGATLLLATALLAVPAAFTAPSEMPTDEALISLVVLGVVCTALALVVFSFLIVEVGPGRALVITYINPVVAVVLGVVILGESLGPGAIAGLLLILAGSWLSTDGRLPPGLRRPAVATP